ncbi:RHG09 protein, partial [Sapayoa aenigma]|nr:RHG09 protein [Sapayoa aenigma]
NPEGPQRAGGRDPPPVPAGPPLQVLGPWERHWDPESGRCFFYSPESGTSSWKPPRRHRDRVGTGGQRGRRGRGRCQPLTGGVCTPSP